jgi:hypothetical protein
VPVTRCTFADCAREWAGVGKLQLPVAEAHRADWIGEMRLGIGQLDRRIAGVVDDDLDRDRKPLCPS